jgi:thiol-disulfide isomerase/thioredoxin
MGICFTCLLIYIVGINSLSAQSFPESASQVLKQAGEQAATENKNVFIIFHASWCGWCHRMDSIMNSADCKELFFNNYVIKHLVVLESPANKSLENPGAMDLLVKYHGDKEGIPFWLIFDKSGKLLADSQERPPGAGLDKPGKNVGCPSTPQEIKFFIGVLKQTSSIKGGQLAVIARQFSRK